MPRLTRLRAREPASLRKREVCDAPKWTPAQPRNSSTGVHDAAHIHSGPVARVSKSIMSTLFSRDAPMDVWLDRVDMLPTGRYVKTLLRVLRYAGRYSALVLDGSARRDQVAAALLSLRRRRPAIVIADSTWKTGTNRLDMMANRLGIRAIDNPCTTFCVLSTFEVESFPRTWGPLKGRVRFVPWPYTLKESDLQRPATDGGRVFAGGNSLRDYDPLIEAAASIPTPIDIATNMLSAEQLSRCPGNVNAGPVAEAEFHRMMLSAAVVVVPLQPQSDRSSGQTTYVNAMVRGKAIVITDAPGVRDYIEDGRTGLIVSPGDSDEVAQAVRRLLDDPDERRLLGDQARQYALDHLSLSHYAHRLLELVDEVLAPD